MHYIINDCGPILNGCEQKLSFLLNSMQVKPYSTNHWLLFVVAMVISLSVSYYLLELMQNTLVSFPLM